MRGRFWYLFLAALVIGLLIGWVDTRPKWDDTGIIAGAILIGTIPLGALMPSRAWVWALTVGGCVLLLGLVLNYDLGEWPALVIAFAGAYAGVLAGRVFRASSSKVQ
jgi:hypothetical protein